MVKGNISAGVSGRGSVVTTHKESEYVTIFACGQPGEGGREEGACRPINFQEVQNLLRLYCVYTVLSNSFRARLPIHEWLLQLQNNQILCQSVIVAFYLVPSVTIFRKRCTGLSITIAAKFR